MIHEDVQSTDTRLPVAARLESLQAIKLNHILNSQRGRPIAVIVNAMRALDSAIVQRNAARSSGIGLAPSFPIWGTTAKET